MIGHKCAHYRVLTRFYYSHIIKNAPPPGSHVFQPTQTIFILVKDITRTNLLTKFYEDRKINMASRVLASGHVFQPTGTIFKFIQDIIRMNLLTKFHDVQTINAAFRVKNALPSCVHVFQPHGTIFKLVQDIIRTKPETKFHEDRTINVPSEC
ncbi:hypothetical protein DPMN_176821 [Dreissena polymorpha]|uniref:Uncharacterized protein n=1 Tax=Dreissena polymorpha TaxID=45954 RepID=A0A9D4E7L5_DREPO|nr:hypothetical protein DPMN_176821 [Dreissena polymorpha]